MKISGTECSVLQWVCLATLCQPATSLPSQAPRDSLERFVAAANSAAARQSWREAAAAWRKVTILNPYSGTFHFSLAGAALNAGDTATAIGALRRFVEVGGLSPTESATTAFVQSPAAIAYQVAQLYGLQNQVDSALSWLSTALRLGFRGRAGILRDAAFEKFRADARLKALAGQFRLERGTRTDKWRADLAFVLQELERQHPAPFRRTPRSRFVADMDGLIREVPSLNDDQVAVRVQCLLRSVGDGHTGILTEGVPGWSSALPLQFESFGDALYVTAADSQYESLVGARVLALESHPIDRVLSLLDSIASRDNDFGVLRNRSRHLRYFRVLRGLGLLRDTTRVRFEIERRDGIRSTVTVTPKPPPNGYSRAWGAPSWVTLSGPTTPETPLWLRNRERPYWFEDVPSQHFAYFGFNLVTNAADVAFGPFVDGMFAYIESHSVDRLVIDLRWNNGGNTQLLPVLIQSLIRSRVNRNGRLFVLTSRYTYSAAMNAATLLEQNTNAIVIGEPTPSSPNFVGESNPIVTPNTGIPFSISNVDWQTSWPFDRRKWIAPRILVPLSLSALRGRDDPAIAAALSYDPSLARPVP